MTNNNEAQVPVSKFKSSDKEIKARTNLFVQVWKFLGINIRMIGIIRKGHH